MGWMEKMGLVKETIPETKSVVPVKEIKTSAVFVPTIGTSTTDYNAYFDKLLQDKNLPGPDYLEFSESLKKLEGKPLSEQQRYENVFDVLSSMGVTVKKLEDSANSYLTIIGEQTKSFEEEYNNSTKTEIDARNKQIETLNNDNIALNNQMQSNSELINKLTQEVIKTRNTLDTENNAFKNAVEYKKSVITNTISKIKTYLNVTK